MADNFNKEARVTADVSQFNKGMDSARAETLAFGDALNLTGRQIAGLEKSLKSVQTRGNAYAGVTRDGANAQGASNEAVRKGVADQRALGGALRDNEGNLNRTRYALYDVATTYAAVSAATLGAIAATSIFATQYETAFTEIERTTLDSAGNSSANLNNLRDQFLDLSEVIPLSFAELTKIGSLGAQLGIAEESLISFTTTTAQFARVSGVSAEESALAFGRIGELLNVSAEEYVNLGSAIAATAVSSAATDKQIISLTRELSAGAAGARRCSRATVRPPRPAAGGPRPPATAGRRRPWRGRTAR